MVSQWDSPSGRAGPTQARPRRGSPCPGFLFRLRSWMQLIGLDYILLKSRGYYPRPINAGPYFPGRLLGRVYGPSHQSNDLRRTFRLFARSVILITKYFSFITFLILNLPSVFHFGPNPNVMFSFF